MPDELSFRESIPDLNTRRHICSSNDQLLNGKLDHLDDASLPQNRVVLNISGVGSSKHEADSDWWFRSGFWLRCVVIFLSLLCTTKATGAVGADVAGVFARARAGAPLRCVAMGGSITQSGQGWIGPWLTKQFPQSAVTMINAGMSATGSGFAVFRLERDVLVHQPDLVLLEFCVNDRGLSDEDAIRYMETLVVRLKSMPHPPAIVIIEAAADQGGVILQRHRAVAQHYGLLEVNLQADVTSYLQSNKLPWSSLFSDDVHPNDAGNQFYSQAITDALEPLLGVEDAREQPASPLPSVLSKKPLLLDGTMVNLASLAPTSEWVWENSLPFWWNRFFQGVLTSKAPAASLRVAVRATTLGLLYPMHPDYSTFRVSLDGANVTEIDTNSRGGYGYWILGMDLPAQEHVIGISKSGSQGEARLGYLLVAGQTEASRTLSAQGHYSPDVLSSMKFTEVPADQWKWCGPFAVAQADALDAQSAIETVFPPENSDPLNWQPMGSQETAWIDLPFQAGNPTIIYTATEVEAKQEENVLLSLAVDYFAKVWVNGELVMTLDAAHGAVKSAQLVPAKLKAGRNVIQLKLGAGSKGFGFSFRIGRSPLPVVK